MENEENLFNQVPSLYYMFYCAICQETAFPPMFINVEHNDTIKPRCQHMYCLPCITHLYLTQKQNTPNIFSCPTCKQHTPKGLKTLYQIYSKPDNNYQELASYIVKTTSISGERKCYYSTRGCLFTTSSSDSMFHHLQHDCIHFFTPCSFSKFGCTQLLSRSEIKSHQDVCEYKKCVCTFCTRKKLFSYTELKKHLSDHHRLSSEIIENISNSMYTSYTS